MQSFFLEISQDVLKTMISIATTAFLAVIGYMIKRQLKLQEKQHHIQQEQAKDIAEIKSDFKLTNLRYDNLEGRVNKVELDVEKIKEKVY